MALRDSFNNPALAGFIREFAGRPMADGTPRRLRGLAGQGDELTPLLGAKRGRGAWARGVLEPHGYGLPKALAPVATPAPDRGARRTEAVCHGGGSQALRQQQDNLCAETQMLRRFVGTDHRMERLTLFLRERDCRRLGTR